MVSKVTVTTGCRLHFSLIDMNADLGRVDGGVGVALRKPGWKVNVQRAKRWEIDPLTRQIVENIKERGGIKGKFKVEVTRSMPVHVGMGSQTQLSLAVAAGLVGLRKKKNKPRIEELVPLVRRGGTSGIGVTSFKEGGLILDGGHSFSEKGGFLPSRYSRVGPPPVLAIYRVPSTWYFVVGIPEGKKIYGRSEARVFEDHTPVPRKEVGALSRLVLLKLLPSVVEKDIGAFGEAIKRIQCLGFKKIENDIQGTRVKRLEKYMMSRGATGAGLSSFGPACYCVVDGRQRAKRMAADVKSYLKGRGGGKVFYSRAAHKGASIEYS